MARSLHRGDTGADVRQAQRDMQSIGYYLSGSLDGIFGPVMDSEVRRLQLDNGMAGDGWYGPNTRALVAAKQKKAGSRAVKKSRKKKRKKDPSTHEVAAWWKYRFIVSPNAIMGFKGLQVKASCELESKDNSQSGVAVRKRANPTEISFDAVFCALTGVSPRSEAHDLLIAARGGYQSHLYVGGKKILSCQFMLTDATLQDVEVTPKGKWVSAKMHLTLKQCTS